MITGFFINKSFDFIINILTCKETFLQLSHALFDHRNKQKIF